MADTAKIDEVIAACNAKLESVTKTSENVVEVVHSVLSDLATVKQVYQRQVQPIFIIPAPTNRDELMLIPDRCHELGDGTLGSGGSGFARAVAESNALLSELAPNSDSIEAYKRLVQMSNGLLAPIETLQPCYESSAGSHMVGWCNAALARVRTPYESLQCKDGHVDLSRLRLKSPAWSECLDKGWLFDIVTAYAVSKMPTLMPLAQEAYNVPQQLSSDESPVQIMKKIHMQFQAADGLHQQDPARHPPADWDVAGRSAARSKPPCAAYMDACVSFTRKFGGSSAERLSELDKYIKICGYGGRSIEGEFLRKLASLSIGGGTFEASRFRLGIYKYMLSDSAKVVGGICTSARESDLVRLVSMVADVKRAETAMNTARRIARELDMASDIEVQMLGVLDVRIVAQVWGRTGCLKVLPHSVEDAAHMFVEEANLKLGTTYASPWAPWVLVERHAFSQRGTVAQRMKAQPKRGVHIPERDHSGHLIDKSIPLREAGFDIGMTVINKKEPHLKAMIDRFGPLEVVVIDHSNEIETNVPYDEFLDKYKAGTYTAPEMLLNRRTKDPQDHISVQITITKGLLVDALKQLWKANSSAYDALNVGLKPKQLIAKTDIDVKQVRLVPFTYNFVVNSPPEPGVVPKAPTFPSVSLGKLIQRPSSKEFILTAPACGQNDTSFVNPWWFLLVSNDDRVANCEVEFIKLSDVLRGAPRGISGVCVPTVVNVKPIKANDILRVFIKKDGAHALVDEAARKNDVVEKGPARGGLPTSNLGRGRGGAVKRAPPGGGPSSAAKRGGGR